MEELSINFEIEKSIAENITNVKILGHEHPDGDSVGSSIGLANYLRYVYPNLRIEVYVHEVINKNLREIIEKNVNVNKNLVNFEERIEPKEEYLVIVLDTPSYQRIAGKKIYDNAKKQLVIDHHYLANKRYGSVCYVSQDEACSQTVVKALDWERYTKTKPSDNIAPMFFYLGILADTGLTKRVDKNTYKILACLTDVSKPIEIDHSKIVSCLVNTGGIEQLKKKAYLLDKLEKNNNTAYIVLNNMDLHLHDISYLDCNSVLEEARDMRDIDVAFAFVERDKNLWKLTMRSKSQKVCCFDLVKEIFDFYDGDSDRLSGHPGAAGCYIHLTGSSVDECTVKIIELIEEVTKC
jgi:phosphoesterase RecJ-like protein